MSDAQKRKGMPIEESEEVGEGIAAVRISESEHERAKRELRRSHDDLEAVVKEHTAALVRANSHRRGKIGEWRRVDRQLLKFDQQFSAVFEYATEGILLADIRTKRFVYGNRTISRMLGYEPDEIKTLGVLDIHPKENLPWILDRFEKLAQTQTSSSQGIRVQRKDGSVFYADITTYQMKVSAETYATGIFRDVTERKRVEEELRKSESKFRAIFDNTSDGMFLVDLKTRKFFMCNATCATMLGYTQEEFSNLDIADIHPREDLPFIYEQIGKFSRGEQGIRSDIRFKRKDGSIFVTDLTPALLTIAQKEYLIISFRDITERKRAEDALRASEQRFRSLVEVTSDFVWEVDQNCFYTYASPKVKDLLGYNPEEIIGKTPFDLMPPDEAERIAKLFWDIVEFRRSFDRLENTNLHKDGRRVVLETSGVPILDAKGSLVGYRGIDRDITERKRAEEMLRGSEERLREAQALGRIGNWEFDIDNQKITLSDQMYRLFERDPALGPPTLQEEAAYYTPEQLERSHEYARRAVEEGKEFRYDLQAHLPSGTLADFSATLRPVKNESGRVIRLFGTVQDITERKRVEESLWEKERAIESSINGIAISDLEGKVTYANAAALKLWGYASEEEILGRNAADFWKTPEKVKGIVVALQGREGWVGELIAKRKDGSTFEVEVSASRVVDKTGKPISLLAAFVDITERKRAQENYRSIFENANVGIYQSTPQGQFLAVNPAFARIFGYKSPMQVVGITEGAAQKLYVDKRERRAFEQLMELHGEVHNLECEACHSDGRKLWIKENARAVRDDKGHVAYYEGFVEDITMQKDAEKRLKQAALRIIEAQEVERKRIARDLHDGVSQLLSSAEFRLASASERIFDRTQKSYDELDDSRTLVEKAIQEIRRVICNLRPAVLDDLGLLPAVRSLCEEFRERTNMKLDFRSTPEPTRLALEVELAFFRIVQEALNNIEKHSGATSVSVSFFQREASVEIKVKDNGVGFDYHAGCKRKGGLSGYGLHTMIDRAASIGGETQILSAIDKGTEVIVRIPLNGSGRCD
jgi:PAS domain S-box-containing protein